VLHRIASVQCRNIAVQCRGCAAESHCGGVSLLVVGGAGVCEKPAMSTPEPNSADCVVKPSMFAAFRGFLGTTSTQQVAKS
jgi:hypothetical protein